jgi:hypothetical protein
VWGVNQASVSYPGQQHIMEPKLRHMGETHCPISHL